MPTSSAPPLSTTGAVLLVVLAVLTILAGTCLGYLAHILFETIIHETAHAIAFTVLGYDVTRISIGGGPEFTSFTLFGIEVTLNTVWWSEGFVRTYADRTLAAIPAILSGPLTPVLVGVVLMALTWRSASGWLGALVGTYTGFTALSAYLNLSPDPFIGNDGSRIDAILREDLFTWYWQYDLPFVYMATVSMLLAAVGLLALAYVFISTTRTAEQVFDSISGP
jgi:hypothetical protein